ncbi:MAG TPA: heparinase II/III family protein [Bryobacteraceae bacterium]|nr:heparinase II/III family protein [Bryobacteraceae bacterium]
MRRREFVVSPLIVGAGLAAPSGQDSFVSERPRLYYDRARIQQLQARVKAEADLAERWKGFLQHADQLLTGEFVTESASNRGSGDDAGFGRPSQQIVDLAFTLGLAYHATNRQQYAAKLREALLHFAAYTTWHGPGFTKRVPPWHSELNTARFCVGMGAGYDALHGSLPPADRKIISEAITRMGILATLDDWISPGSRIHALDSMGHNWWSVCVSSAGIAVLSLYGDDARAPEWLRRVNGGITQWFSFGGNVLQNKSITFDSGGAFYESVNYANYALFEYLRFRLAQSNVFPHTRQPDYAPLSKISDFFFQTFYPSSISPACVNFGDSPTHLQVAPTIRLLNEMGYSHPAASWYLASWSLANTKSTRQPPPQALDFLCAKPMPSPARPPSEKSKLYSDIGWATLRDSWNNDSTMLAVKSGFTWNHAHADAGSFILFHAGVPLLIDSGTCSYGDPAYSHYYVQSPAHNVVLFNGQGEPPDDHLHGVKFPGQLHRLIDHLDVKYVFADATGPMAEYFSRNYRHWLWLDNVILIFDDVESHQDGAFDWLLHYAGAAGRNGNQVRLTNGPATADVRFLFPEALDAREEQGLAEHDPQTKTPYLAFRTREAARVQKFITAIIPHGQGAGTLPVINLLSATDAIGARIENGNQVTDVYLNLQADGRRMHVNSNNTIAGWETDAYLLAWTRPSDRIDDPAAVTRFFVSCGSYLRRDGKVHLDSLSKVFAVWEPGKPSGSQVLGQNQRSVDLL